MEFCKARLSDIPAIVELQQQCHVSQLDTDDKQDGFLNTVLTDEYLTPAINNEQSVYIGLIEGQVVAMAVCASWYYWQFSPTLTSVGEGLTQPQHNAFGINRENSVFWGPVCIAKAHRGRGSFEGLFEFTRKACEADYIYTYVHQDNHRSLAAHVNKAHFSPLGELDINDQPFIELAIKTKA
ncbi:GNAT family N-acetyltransferase [Vibrio intestinalis]|uniref:GNAT family N-acetyltransferase n=1 Tax=Vibrio intestinalis TaxID=2933291 RepID=UPI0021A5D0FF|nr:GNAT family acetyltransferase [Vibrio intestinalis]